MLALIVLKNRTWTRVLKGVYVGGSFSPMLILHEMIYIRTYFSTTEILYISDPARVTELINRKFKIGSDLRRLSESGILKTVSSLVSGPTEYNAYDP
jgi:hypothetical protein